MSQDPKQQPTVGENKIAQAQLAAVVRDRAWELFIAAIIGSGGELNNHPPRLDQCEEIARYWFVEHKPKAVTR